MHIKVHHGAIGTEVLAELISTVTEEVMAEVQAWQSQPLEPMYPVVFFDALRVKIRDDGQVRNKAICLALAVLPDGTRDVQGLWIEHTEGAKFWLKALRPPSSLTHRISDTPIASPAVLTDIIGTTCFQLVMHRRWRYQTQD